MENPTECKPAYLVLEDGRVFKGKSFGARGEALGHLCFNTSCIGSQQLLTSPDSAGQVIVQTFPCAGNYGVNPDDFESSRAAATGFIVREWCPHPSNFRSTGDFHQFLEQTGIVGLYGIDTRALVRSIRDKGECGCMLLPELPDDLSGVIDRIRLRGAAEFPSFAADKVKTVPSGNGVAVVAMLDLGCSNTFLNSLTSSGLDVARIPVECLSTIDGIGPAGIVISSGPERIESYESLLPAIRSIWQSGLPVFAVGLGHLLLALALGAELGTLPHGHRGANIPALNRDTRRTVVTTQNHRLYVRTVLEGTISEVNPADGSCESIRYPNAISTQYLPSYDPGDRNTGGIFREFLALVEQNKRKGGK